MDRFKELQTLVNLSKALNQELDSALLEEFEELNNRQEKIAKRIKENLVNDLAVFFKVPAYDPHDEPLTEKEIEKIEEVAKEEISEPVTNVEPLFEKTEAVVEDAFKKTETVVNKVSNSITKQIQHEATLVKPDPQKPLETASLEQKIKYLEKWVSRIASTGPGGGAGDILSLSFFAKTVTNNYTIGRKDYYVGVNASTSVTITLPASAKSGQSIIIKDESGNCSTNPITLTGTIDNNTSGAIISIDNGGLHLIYNAGWKNTLTGNLVSGGATLDSSVLASYTTNANLTSTLTNYVTNTSLTSTVTTAVNNLVNGAPGVLDTIGEIATALNNNSSILNTLVSNTNLTSTLTGYVTNANLTSTLSTYSVPNRIVATASVTSVTIDASVTDQYHITSLAVNATFNAPINSSSNGQKLIIRIQDNGTPRTLSWTTSTGGFRVIGVTLPTTTVAFKNFYVGCIYNSTDVFWDVISVAQQA
jgi:hypothetical protein